MQVQVEVQVVQQQHGTSGAIRVRTWTKLLAINSIPYSHCLEHCRSPFTAWAVIAYRDGRPTICACYAF